ncbi:MAG: serine/threonine protein kinase [Proteobacteria bacterium]|nr:serine/threonine protein kinase [Pseudomonadota bacterium]
MNVHATCVALRLGRTWRGVLLRGPSGAGKSDLALRLVDEGARLVADDRTDLAVQGGRLVATAPRTIAGLLEVRGLGIVSLPAGRVAPRVAVALLVDLVAPRRIERMPSPAREKLMGVTLPVLALAPFEASAAAKLRLALAQTAAA